MSVPTLAPLTAGIATGTPNGAKFLRDDMTWQTPSGGSSSGVNASAFFSRSSVSANGITVSGTVPGPYTFTVPTGVTKIEVEGSAAGGSSPFFGTNANNTTISGSTSGTILTLGGGQAGSGSTGGAGGTVTGPNGGVWMPGSVGASGSTYGGMSMFSSNNGPLIFGWGFGGSATGSSAGGGGASGRGILTVVPGETITVTVGGLTGTGDGGPGFIRLQW